MPLEVFSGRFQPKNAQGEPILPPGGLRRLPSTSSYSSRLGRNVSQRLPPEQSYRLQQPRQLESVEDPAVQNMDGRYRQNTDGQYRQASPPIPPESTRNREGQGPGGQIPQRPDPSASSSTTTNRAMGNYQSQGAPSRTPPTQMQVNASLESDRPLSPVSSKFDSIADPFKSRDKIPRDRSRSPERNMASEDAVQPQAPKFYNRWTNFDDVPIPTILKQVAPDQVRPLDAQEYPDGYVQANNNRSQPSNDISIHGRADSAYNSPPRSPTKARSKPKSRENEGEPGLFRSRSQRTSPGFDASDQLPSSTSYNPISVPSSNPISAPSSTSALPSTTRTIPLQNARTAVAPPRTSSHRPSDAALSSTKRGPNGVLPFADTPSRDDSYRNPRFHNKSMLQQNQERAQALLEAAQKLPQPEPRIEKSAYKPSAFPPPPPQQRPQNSKTTGCACVIL
ncbi:hypothetical protein DFS34DRAFT_170865 [Phlyctochytrium arcticum]|nr:hypothetical protein DFS34DRAFT_170865 [Phlyctochytrium arcticum]